MTGTVLDAYTLIHVAISLVGIVTGFMVLYGLLKNDRMDALTKIFLWTTVLTSVTGYGFPVEHLMPSHIVGALSLVVLAVAIYARYSRHLAGGWRSTYVITAMIALYFNVFVFVVQAFAKVPALKALAPTQKEPPFGITQLTVLVAFVVVTIAAVRKFRAQPQAISSTRRSARAA